MFNLFVKFKWRKCVSVTTRLNIHTHPERKNRCFDRHKIVDILTEEFGWDRIATFRLLGLNDFKYKTDEQIRHTCQICRKYDITFSDNASISSILRLRPDFLENRILMLQEFGIPHVKDTSLYWLNSTMFMEIEQFKKAVGIPADVDIIQRFFENVFPKSYEPPQENLRQSTTFLELRIKLLLHYVRWRFQIPNELEVPTQSWRPLLYSSLNLINVVVHYLLNDLGWDTERVLKNNYVCRYDFQNMKRVINEMEKVPNFDVKQFFYIYPRTLGIPADNCKKILDILQQYEIPKTSIRNNPNVLRKPSDFIEKKINYLTNNPVLMAFKTHPNFLRLIFVKHDLNKRIELLHSMNFTFISLNTLILDAKGLQTICEIGYDWRTSLDLKTFMDYHFPRQGKTLTQELKKNPNWRHFSLLIISETLTVLKQYVSMDDISNNIHIILYNKSEIEKTWNFVQNQYKNYEGHQFTSSQKLALCLYHIEIKHHFSGDGILISKDTKDEQVHNMDEPNFKNEELIEVKVASESAILA